MTKVEESFIASLETAQNILLIAVFVIWLLTGILLWRSPDFVPLFFSRPYGRDQLASKWWLILYLVLSVLIYLFGYFLNKKIKSSAVSKSIAIWINFGSIILLLLSEIFITTLIF